jgi:PAS domain S-box-containing protein
MGVKAEINGGKGVSARRVEAGRSSSAADPELAQLCRERAILAAIMDSTDFFLVYLDRDFNFVRVNDAYAAAANKSPEELVGKNHFELYPHPENEAIFRQVRDTAEPVFHKDKPFEYPDQPDRGVTYWDWSLVPVKDGTGLVVGLVFSLRETTSYKQDELTLAESEERFRLMAETGRDIIFQLDLAGTITYVSQAVRLYGYAPEEVVSRPFANFVPPEDLPRAGEALHLIIGGESLSLELPLLKADSTRLAFGISATPIRRDGKVVGLQGVARDISERKAAEAELLRLNRTMKALVDSRQATIMAGTESAYLDEICRVVVEDCGFSMVWIGYAENDPARTVRPVSQAGLGTDYLETVRITWGDDELGRGPTGTAIRTGRMTGCRNMATEPDFAPWRKQAAKRGYSSSLAFPLMKEGRAFGALTIYAKEADGFSEVEIKMLGELAEDLAYGIVALRERSARAKAERALRQNEAQLQTILNNLTEGLVVANLETDLFYWNPAAVAMHGFAEAEEGRRYLRNFSENFELSTIPEGNLPLAEWPMARILNGETLHGLEVRVRRLDRDWQRIFSYSGTLARDRQGKPLLAVMVISDVTERKMFEEALVRAKQEWERTFDAVPDLIAILDNKHRMVRANRAMAGRLGMTPEECVGLRCFSCVHGTSCPPDLCPHAKTMRDGREHSAELREERLGGDFLVTTTPLFDEDEMMIGSVHVARDITERKKAEEKIRSLNEELKDNLFQLDEVNRELERSNQDLQQFAYTAAHDLQAPLHTVASFVQLLRRRYQGILDEKGETFIAQAIEGTSLMQRLLQDLLAFARVGGGRLNLQPLPLGRVIDRVLLNLDKSIRDHQAEIIIADDLPLVLADESQLLHLLQNLVANALKFRGPEAPRLEIFSRDGRGEWIICVRDNGIGLDPQQADRIFLVFQRLHSRDKYEGTGIGLAICKKIVERHGGRIWVESAPGAGATFCFSLPARRGS